MSTVKVTVTTTNPTELADIADVIYPAQLDSLALGRWTISKHYADLADAAADLAAIARRRDRIDKVIASLSSVSG